MDQLMKRKETKAKATAEGIANFSCVMTGKNGSDIRIYRIFPDFKEISINLFPVI